MFLRTTDCATMLAAAAHLRLNYYYFPLPLRSTKLARFIVVGDVDHDHNCNGATPHVKVTRSSYCSRERDSSSSSSAEISFPAKATTVVVLDRRKKTVVMKVAIPSNEAGFGETAP